MQSPCESGTGGVHPRDPEPYKREAERFLRDGGLSAKEERVRGASSLGETPSPPSTSLRLQRCNTQTCCHPAPSSITAALLCSSSPEDAWAGARLSLCSAALVPLAPLPARGPSPTLKRQPCTAGSPGKHSSAHGRWGVCLATRPTALGRRCQGVCASHAAWQLRVENSWGLVPGPTSSAVAREGMALPHLRSSAASSPS